MNGGFLNQTRIWVFDDSDYELLSADSILVRIQELHAPQTLFNYPLSLMGRYHHLSQLIFGATISTKCGYAIIPTPSQAMCNGHIYTEQIGDMLNWNQNYDDTNGPMKAIVTADEQYVQILIDEFKALLADGHPVSLK